MFLRKNKILLLIVSLFIFFSFIKEGKTQPNDKNSIVIGVIAAKTGSASEYNKLMFTAAKFAVDKINSQGGIKDKKIQIIEYDNLSSSLGSKAAAEKAVKDNVLAVIGPARSSFALASCKVLQEAGIPVLLPVSTNPKVTLIGDYIFRMVYLDSYQGKILATFSYNTLKAKNAVILVNTNRVYSIDLSDFFKDNFEKLGGKVLLLYDYLDTETDYKDFITKTIPLKPDIVFIPSESRDVGFIMKQAIKMGLKTQFLGSDSWSENIYEFAGEFAEGGFFTSFWHRSLKSSETFVKEYEAKVGHINSAMIPLTYEAVMLLKDAIIRADAFDKKIIKEKIQETKEFKGICGDVTFDKNGDPLDKGAIVLQLRNNKSNFIEHVYAK